MQRIKAITLRNFKFFYGTETEYKHNKIEIDGNNLLLYGENGSGKSSVYWALYTFLQSTLKKEDDKIEKYFTNNGNESLKNRYAANDTPSGIIIEISTDGNIIPKEISNTSITTKADTQVRKILSVSDFLNYKYLSKIYDFRNSQEIDLFPLFVSELLMYIDFEEEFTLNDGTLSGSTHASDWWSFISEKYLDLPKTKSGKIGLSTTECKKLRDNTIPKFIEKLKTYLQSITEKTDWYLSERFHQPFKIVFDIEGIDLQFNDELIKKSNNGPLLGPKMSFKVILTDPNIPEEKRTIEHPHTFLNEAKLTAISLAIRFAMLDVRPSFDNTAKLLILDDFLISLDMSNRDIILDIILTEFQDFQLFILTHDKAFYNLTKRRIAVDNGAANWVFKEMYQDIDPDTKTYKPFILDSLSNLSLAEKYFKEFDYAACGNYLRKECERIILSLLPDNLTIKPNLDNGREIKQLEDLISSFEKWYKELGGDYSPFIKLKEYKDLLLNPLSHDNISSPIYRIELENIRAILIKLNQLSKKILIDINEAHYLATLKEIDSSGNQWEYIISMKENFYGIKDINGVWRVNNPLGKVESGKNVTLDTVANINQQPLKLNKIYDQIRFRLKNKIYIDGVATDTIPPQDLSEIIFIDNIKLDSLLN